MANQMKPNGWLNAPRTLIIGHRGASAMMPENSLAAFSLAVKQGADGIEMDVRLSKDGRPVLVHDATLQRLSGNPSKVCDLTADELKRVEIGHGQTVALLEELFNLLGSRVLYNIELKEFGLRDQGLVDRVAKEISAFGLQSQVLISSFNPLVVRRARRRFPPTVAVALIRGPGVYRHTRWTVDTGVENPHYSLVDEAYMDRAARLGRYTFAWTVDDVAEARRLVALGVNGIITNVPDQMQEQLAFP
jgi:glycerophosphoryl diester phosphodiesterase